jgi:outer membrane protein TolC
VRRANAIVLPCVLAAGCAAFLRPEGDGGWSTERRGTELAQVARRAGVALTPPAPTHEPAPRTLDLATALAMAEKGNRHIASSRRQLAIRAEEVRDARGALLPQTVGSGRYTWYTDAQRNSIQLPIASSGKTSIEIRDSELGAVNGTMTLPLDLGELRGALAVAQAGYRGEQARLWATTLEQKLAVVRAYFEFLEAKRLAEVTEENLALYRQQLANAQNKFDAGRLTKNQLLVVQVALRATEEERQQRALAIAQARYALNAAIGAEIDAATEPVDVSEHHTVPAVEEALRSAYTGNPVLRSLLEEQQRLEAVARSRTLGRLPRLYTGAAIDYSNSQLLEPRDIGSGFVGFRWDLGTDDRREAEIAQARIDAERNRLEIEGQLRDLEASVRFTQQAAGERMAALDAAQVAVGQAEENVRIRQQQFDAGRASSEDVLDAQALLSAQRATRATALYQAHLRLAELKTLMGVDLGGVGR